MGAHRQASATVGRLGGGEMAVFGNGGRWPAVSQGGPAARCGGGEGDGHRKIAEDIRGEALTR
jgi:hypothetical protein